jgi:hypothetical protein
MFKSKTVDGILATFNKAIADLEALNLAAQKKAWANTDEIDRLTAERFALNSQATRATLVAGKLKTLIEGE